MLGIQAGVLEANRRAIGVTENSITPIRIGVGRWGWGEL